MVFFEPDRKQRRVKYIPLDRKQFLCFENGKWRNIKIENDSSFEQVEFIPYTTNVYVITEDGKVYETIDEGQNWNLSDLNKIVSMKATENGMTFLKNTNTLIFKPLE